MKKSPHPVDEYVGMRLRWCRKSHKISQEKLGEMLGVTFQQIQKYEKGSNRISASRLYEIARILNVNIGYFFEGYDEAADQAMVGFAEDGDSDKFVFDLLRTQDGMRLIQSFARIDNPTIRKRVLDLVQAFSEEEPAAPAAS